MTIVSNPIGEAPAVPSPRLRGVGLGEGPALTMSTFFAVGPLPLIRIARCAGDSTSPRLAGRGDVP
jgi:hypothetical protein